LGISKYNAEWYYDPTAYEGIRQADADARKLKITYPTGYMELNLDCFFPCTRDKARKIFPLIHRYSSESDKHRLHTFLMRKANICSLQMQEFAKKAASHPLQSKECRELISRFKEARLFRQRTNMNIEMLNAERDV
jgi:hypothetical protein